LQSVSRLTSEIAAAGQQEAGRKLRQALAAYREAEDLIRLGAYVAGSDPVLDAGIRLLPEMLEFLRQDHTSKAPLPDTLKRLEGLAAKLAAPAAGAVAVRGAKA